MSLEILKEKIKAKELTGVFYLFGEEEYLKNYYYQILRKKTVTDMTEFNVTELNGENLSLNTFENVINSFPMMSDIKFISVIDLEHKLLKEDYKTKLTDLLQNVPDYCCIVFLDTVHKGGKDDTLKNLIQKAGGLAVAVNRQTPAQLAAWGKRHFASLDKKISNDDMYYILRTAENDMLSLKNEITKIAGFAAGETITRKDIDAVITKSLENNRFAISNALSRRDFREMIRVADELYAQNYKEIEIANLIYRCIVDLLRASFAVSSGKRNTDMGNDFGMNERGAAITMNATKNMTERQLMECAELCLVYDKKLKSEGGDKKEMIYRLIAELMNCGVRR